MVPSILFLCTGNSARSVMAECLANDLSKGQVRAYSAGSHPAPDVHPNTVRVLTDHGHAVSGVRAKSWDEFARPGAPSLDLVVTVCDNAKGEVCPIWPGRPSQGHWGFPDPVDGHAADPGPIEPFEETYSLIRTRLEKFLREPVAGLSLDEWAERLSEPMPGAGP